MSGLSEDVIKPILYFLSAHEYYKSLLALEQETAVKLRSYGKELDFLYALITEGRFGDAEKFVLPLKSRSESDYNAALLALRKQKFLENIENAGSPNMQELTALLREIESLSTAEEFSQLCLCLSLDKVTDHADYAK